MKYQVVVAACILHQGKFLISQRLPEDNLAGRYELPGGKLEEGETLEDALYREIQEELGISVIIGRLFNSFINHLNNDNIILFYTCYLFASTVYITNPTAIFITWDDIGKYDLLPGSLETIQLLTPVDILRS